MLALQLDGDPGPPPPTPPPPPELPIDNGLTLLLIAGLIYGVYIMWKKFGLNRDSS
jgi:hypothetical protein